MIITTNPAVDHDCEGRFRVSERWVFTKFKPDIEFYYRLKRNPRVDMFIMGVEFDKNSGYHFQGYLILTHALNYFEVKNIVQGAWCEPAKGTLEENCIYCSKQGFTLTKSLTDDVVFDRISKGLSPRS